MTSNIFDLGLGGFIYIMIIQGVLTLAIGVGSFLMITVLEGAILRLIRWGDIWQSLRDSLLINFGTTVLGFALAFGVFGFYDAFYGMPYELDEIMSVMFFLWALTTIIEGFLLGFMRRRPAMETWPAAIIINTCSYLLLTIVIYKFPFASIWY